jgi:hypothetical protein
MPEIRLQFMGAAILAAIGGAAVLVLLLFPLVDRKDRPPKPDERE